MFFRSGWLVHASHLPKREQVTHTYIIQSLGKLVAAMLVDRKIENKQTIDISYNQLHLTLNDCLCDLLKEFNLFFLSLVIPSHSYESSQVEDRFHLVVLENHNANKSVCFSAPKIATIRVAPEKINVANFCAASFDYNPFSWKKNIKRYLGTRITRCRRIHFSRCQALSDNFSVSNRATYRPLRLSAWDY